MANIYKKFKQEDRVIKRSTDLTSVEKSKMLEINDKFIELFKLKHLS